MSVFCLVCVFLHVAGYLNVKKIQVVIIVLSEKQSLAWDSIFIYRIGGIEEHNVDVRCSFYFVM